MPRYVVSAFRAEGDARGKRILHGMVFEGLDAALAFCGRELVRARGPGTALPWTIYRDAGAICQMAIQNPFFDRAATREAIAWSREHVFFNEGASLVLIEREDFFQSRRRSPARFTIAGPVGAEAGQIDAADGVSDSRRGV
ncbi:MAG: hypothetical protein JO010_09165 [Alphaproteobacteria bacterium]|nr:hypothetical protein [Alphaproteobacteria bacterium]